MAGRDTTRRECGFTIIELLVAMVIVGILLSSVAIYFKQARTTSWKRQTQAAAMSYSRAITAYKADNAGAIPALGGPDWPTAQALKGPRNRITGRTYMRSTPDGMTLARTSGRGKVRLTTTVPQASDGGAAIVYTRGPVTPVRDESYRFEIAAYFKGKHLCSVGDLPSRTISRRCTG